MDNSSRWLLAAHDRSHVAALSLTQELISVMRGVRRSTVSIAAGTLQRAGVIQYPHGRITILDRTGLENAASECYDAVASEYRALFGEYPLDVTRRSGPPTEGVAHFALLPFTHTFVSAPTSRRVRARLASEKEQGL